MTLSHPPFLDPEKWYVISSNYGEEKGRPGWHHRRLSLDGPNSMVSVEWNILDKHGFGYGFQFGRNGDESDAGLNLYCGRLFSTWFRIRAPWLKWLKVRPGGRNPYDARHTGFKIHPYDGCYVDFEFDNRAHRWSSSDPWWRRWSITKTTLLGRRGSETIVEDSGTTQIPMPEGNYPATWEKRLYVSRYLRFPGTWRDKLIGPRNNRSVTIDIEGGIPCEGKGENSWDCGMDGVFGTSGSTLEEAIGNTVKAVLRDRKNYGGPHNLERPMTVTEASNL